MNDLAKKLTIIRIKKSDKISVFIADSNHSSYW